MKHVIERIYRRTTEYSDPKQATTTSNALDLLSSGIYTEEERFIFELLQNAVDAYDDTLSDELNVKIVLTEKHIVFMHNGQPFSERDLEGLCDIGNGNKTKDSKKIGYKGIGFKSVFMHSRRVTVWTDGLCFKFDQEECNEMCRRKGERYSEAKLPWQIIPILLSDLPVQIGTEGYRVVTFLETGNRSRLLIKVQKLLSDSRFLLFLKVGNIRVNLFDNEKQLLSLSKEMDNGILLLSQNGAIQSRWLIHTPAPVAIPQNVKDDITRDSNTPTKLKESNAIEISFAIALDEGGNIQPEQSAAIYTYLPTSFCFGFPFIVNSNFITDAGRQQLIKDSEWNKFIFSQIPSLYLAWIKSFSLQRKDYYKVLPPVKTEEDELSIAYQNALTESLKFIDFLPTLQGTQVKVSEALIDTIDLNEALTKTIFNSFVQTKIRRNLSLDSLIAKDASSDLRKYNITILAHDSLRLLLENSERYLSGMSDSRCVTILSYLQNVAQQQKEDFVQKLSYTKLIFDENDCLSEPITLFFPSRYREENDVTESIKVIRQSLYDAIVQANLAGWVAELGVKEMSNLSVIERVLCQEGYITKDNAIDVMRFIFDANKKEAIIDSLSNTLIKNLKVLSNTGNLKSIDSLFLDESYETNIHFPFSATNTSVFVSNLYIRPEDKPIDWQLFFIQLGANTKMTLISRRFEKDSAVYDDLHSYVNYCIAHEKNWDYPIHTGLFKHLYISVQLPPILTLGINYVVGVIPHFSYDLGKFVWSEVLKSKVSLDPKKDFIAGHTGWNYYAYGYLKDDVDGHRYLGEYYLQRLIRKYKVLPGNDNELHRSTEMLAPTEENIQLAGKYYPILSLNYPMDSSWFNYVSFKEKLNLDDYLTILGKISKDVKKEEIFENKKRISRIYQKIIEQFDLSEESSDYNTIKNWATNNLILSKDGRFLSPLKLNLIAPTLQGVELADMVYFDRQIPHERLRALMNAMGVLYIDEFRVEYDGEKSKPEVLIVLRQKIEFFTALVIESEKVTQEIWDSSKKVLEESFKKIQFVQCEKITITYGSQLIKRSVYADKSKFYFVGNFSIANKELLLDDIAKVLGIKDKMTMFSLMQMNDCKEMKEYLAQKGYSTEFISEQLIKIRDDATSGPTITGADPTYGGLTQEEMRAALEEAKDAILEELENDGYDTSNAKWNRWTCVDGVTKGREEYPLVVRSNKSGRATTISPEDWTQLMKPNAMFAVLTREGVGTLSLRQILQSKQYINIRFSSSNLDSKEHISTLANVLTYFNGIQFDFGSYIPAALNRWQRFNAPEKETGELAAPSTIALPD